MYEAIIARRVAVAFASDTTGTLNCTEYVTKKAVAALCCSSLCLRLALEGRAVSVNGDTKEKGTTAVCATTVENTLLQAEDQAPLTP